MKSKGGIVGLAIGLLCLGAVTSAADLLRLDADTLVEENIYGDRWYEQVVELAQGFPVLVKTEVSRRGNGVMSIKNLQLRLYDAHDDAAYFENWLLRTEFVDLNGDGYADIRISGTVVYDQHEKADLEPEKNWQILEHVLFAYRYDPVRDGFYLLAQETSFSLDPFEGPGTSKYYLCGYGFSGEDSEPKGTEPLPADSR
ncbi:MAG: hypothetical protein E1N59_2961 [Puniceicoccaceae bacterium 5H]|nr:MAG: hypothetical protein E1N59_2961 [Puniceicoccaceae bacterium 5H]